MLFREQQFNQNLIFHSKMSLWEFNLHEYLSADNLLHIYMAHSTHDIWALCTSSVMWWSAIVTIFRVTRHRGYYLQRYWYSQWGQLGVLITLSKTVFSVQLFQMFVPSLLTPDSHAFPGPCLHFQYYMCILCWDFFTLLLTNANLNPLLRPKLPFLENIKK